jgi:hypothetical protein
MKPLAGHSALTLEEAVGAFAEMEEFGALPTEEITMDFDEEPTQVCWRPPEELLRTTRPTVPTTVVVDWDETKEG